MTIYLRPSTRPAYLGIFLLVMTCGAAHSQDSSFQNPQKRLSELSTHYRQGKLSDTLYLRGVDSIASSLLNDDSLVEELAIYREVFSRTCVGLAVDGGEGAALIRLNEAFAQLHGYTTDELVGRPIEMLFHPVEKPLADAVKAKTDELGEALLTERHVRKDGSSFPVLKQITSITGGKGLVQFRIYTVLDLDAAQSWQSFVFQNN